MKHHEPVMVRAKSSACAGVWMDKVGQVFWGNVMKDLVNEESEFVVDSVGDWKPVKIC